MLGIYFAEQVEGLIRIASVQPSGLIFMLGFFNYLPQAFAEELFCRGLMLNGLFLLLKGRHKSFAVVVSAIAFGFLHAINPHASIVSVFGNFLGGIVYALAYLRSGSLWLGTGVHFGWNFVQGTILGFPASGLTTFSFITQTAPGDILLTGGAYGPEAGLIGMCFRFVAIVAILAWTHRERNRRSRREMVNH